MQKKIQSILQNLPQSPGVYQFFNASGEIIYIGKSVNLKSRVNSYFNGKSKLNFAKQKMVGKIADIKYIMVNNETESLILETNLIKTHKPKYNILMKDDKNHLYIKITKGEFPKIIKTRIGPSEQKRDGEYFGPYLNGNYVFFILKFIKKHFGYGVGSHNFFLSKNSYNLDKYLFKGNRVENHDIKTVYQQKISQIRDFIKGDYKKIIPELKAEMQTHASKLEFEKAKKIKDTIEAIESLEINQIARDGIIGDYDLVNFLEKYEHSYISHIKIRDNKIVGMQNFELENELSLSKEELIFEFIERHILVPHLTDGETKKMKIILPEIEIEEHEMLSYEFPKIGAKKELLDLAYKNVYEFAYKKYIASLSVKGFSKKTMTSLLETLGYEQKNSDIVFECNDISHLSGNHTVASRSVIENGKPNPKKYRKYRIKSLEEQKIDDFGSMREVMRRRLKEMLEQKNMPDLIIIDGGKGQLGSVIETVTQFTSETTDEGKTYLENLQIVSIAKREEELFVYRNGDFKKYVLDKSSEELRFTQKIRDEAHRFAITFNRDSRSKSMKKNILESLPGFGPVTRKKILKNFGSVDNLKNIKTEELKKYLTKTQLETLRDHGFVG